MTANHPLAFALAITSVLSAGPALAQPAGRPTPPVAQASPVAPVPPVSPVPPGSIVAPAPPDFTHLADIARGFAPMADRDHFAGLEALHGYGFQETAQAAADRSRAREAADRARTLDREARAYEDGMRQIYDNRFDRAVTRFDELVAMKGSRVDAGLYWKAYAQDRLGQRAEALATIAALTKEHPNSRYVQQARALEAEVRRNAGQPVRPQDQADEELKLMALAALQHQAPEQAVPMLEKLLAGTASPRLKERALFVLAQSNSPQAREVLRGVAKGNSTPELQSRAITYLGTHGGKESRTVLADVYSSTTDVDMKKRILRAFMVGGDKDRLLTAAQTEQNPELRATAVQQLGAMGAQAELWQLYGKESSLAIKKQIIQAMHIGGDSARMIELAKGEANPDLRRTAIRNLGMMDGQANADALSGIYASEQDPTVKRAVIQALGMNDNAAALVAIARKESDPAMKKEIVTRLSHMNSKVATDYLLEILSK